MDAAWDAQFVPYMLPVFSSRRLAVDCMLKPLTGRWGCYGHIW